MAHSIQVQIENSIKITAMAVVVALIAGCSGDGKNTSSTAAGDATDKASMTPLEAAKDKCARTSPYATIGDEGKSLLLDHKGEEETAGLSIEDVACVLAELNVSDSVSSQIDSTRALDGRQTGSWDQFTASWIYHPDDGIDIIITMNDS